jgi:hypothetical protein
MAYCGMSPTTNKIAVRHLRNPNERQSDLINPLCNLRAESHHGPNPGHHF